MSNGKKVLLFFIGFLFLYWLSMSLFGEDRSLVLPAVAAVAWFAIVLWRQSQRSRDMAALVALSNDLGVFVSKNFLVSACPTCRETLMHLTSISPSGRTITYSCIHCGERRQRRADAGTPEALEIGRVAAPFFEAQSQFKTRWRATLSTPAPFETAADPLPFEQTTRGPISRAVRSEVWRRYNGRCAECGSNQNLQFDHIIPVAKGGASTAANLQLLCQLHNSSKGASI